MRWRILLIPILTLFVAVSCDKQPVGPQAEPVAELPTFDFMNGPEQSGMVWRWNSYHIQFWDFEETPGNPWLVLFGLPEGDVLLDCGGDGTSELLNIHEVWFDETWRSIVNYRRRNATVRAFDAAEFWGTWDSEGPCAAFALDPLAEGMANQQFNDNDLVGVMPHAGWQEKANGYVDYMGERYRLHFSAHWKWNDSLDEPYSRRIEAWIR